MKQWIVALLVVMSLPVWADDKPQPSTAAQNNKATTKAKPKPKPKPLTLAQLYQKICQLQFAQASQGCTGGAVTFQGDRCFASGYTCELNDGFSSTVASFAWQPEPNTIIYQCNNSFRLTPCNGYQSAD